MHGNLRRRVAGRRVVLKVRGLLGISDVERIFCVLFGGIQDHLAEEGVGAHHRHHEVRNAPCVSI